MVGFIWYVALQAVVRRPKTNRSTPKWGLKPTAPMVDVATWDCSSTCGVPYLSLRLGVVVFFWGGAGLMRKPNRPETCVAMHILLLKVPLFSQLYMLYVRICRIYTYIYIINKQSTWRNKMIGYMKMAIWVAWCDMDGVCNPHSWNCCDRIAENVRIWSSWY